MTTGTGVFWLGAWLLLGVPLFFADIWMAAALYILVCATYCVVWLCCPR